MKPFDTKGEYTPEEVKAALAGVNGTRQLSFRYERLTQHNTYLEDIDYVQSCSIENNALADIKRTAKFNVLDTGTINYLQDRIKPYVRIAMPADKDYADTVRSLDPDVWWRMDDIKPATIATVNTSVPDGVNYNTRETAYVGDGIGEKGYIAYIQAASGTLRGEFWLQFEITSSEALQIWLSHYENIPGLSFEMYTSPAVDGELTMFYPNDTDHVIDDWDYNQTTVSSYAFPTRGFYYIRATTTNSTVAKRFKMGVMRPARLEDSSNNNVYATGKNLNLRNQSLIGGGYSMQVDGYDGTYQNMWLADQLDLPHGDAIVTNIWIRFEDMLEYDDFSLQFGTEDSVEWDMYNAIWTNSETIGFDMYVPNFWGMIEVPSAKYVGTTMMVTTVYEPFKNKASLYLNAEYIGEYYDDGISQPQDSITDFMENNITAIDGNLSGGDVVTLDDVTIFFKSISAKDISEIYSDGIGASTGGDRSGYVEWPQGVFVLSSPSRVMEDGNTITRAVEGYDQLVNLKEDTFDYRYSVKPGTKYTEAVFNVLQSSESKVALKVTPDYWTTHGSAEILSDSSVRLDTYDAEGNNVYTGDILTLKDISVSAKAEAPSNVPAAQSLMYLRYYDALGGSKVLWVWRTGNSVAFGGDEFGGIAGAWDSNYAYWRMRESGGYFYWETSPDNKVWTERRKMKLSIDTYTPVAVQFSTQSGQAVAGIGFSEIAISGHGAVNASIVKSETKLPTGMEWEPGTSKLTIVNDLLSAINYESATYDEDGVFIGKPYISPQNRTSGFRYATDSESVITGDVDQTVDMFAVPNKWVVVVSDPDRPMLVGEYTNDDPHSPTSTVSRGRTIVDYRTEQAAPNQLTLDAQAARLAFEASQVYETIEFDTAIMPIHQNADVYDLVVDGLVINNKYSETSWGMELKNGATMSHKVRRVVSV